MNVRTWLLPCLGLICNAAFATPSWDEFGRQLEAGDIATARATADNYLQDDPLHPMGLLMLLTVQQNQQRGLAQPELVQRFKSCIEQYPEAWQCPLGLGELYGMEASQGGMLKGMRLADDIRDQFKRAVELDPLSLRARTGLHSFYSAAPAIAGGGADKAAALVADYARLQPVQARLLEVGQLLKNKQTSEATQILLALPADAGFDARSVQLRGLINLGFLLIGDNQLSEAKGVLQAAAERYPKSPYPPMGLGRIHLQQGEAKTASKLLERALLLDPQCGANYRLALAYEALGRNEDAIAQFERFLKSDAAARNKDLVKDSRQRLKALGSKPAA